MRRFASTLLIALAISSLAAAAPAKENWDNLCASCHGKNGDGKTPKGVQRYIKDYTDPKVQAAFSDAALLRLTLFGVSGDGVQIRMPAYKDKMTVGEAKELVALIRAFAKK